MTNTTAFHELILKDAVGIQASDEFIGATLSKVHLDISAAPDLVVTAAVTNIADYTLYAGLFVADNVVPEPTIWTPNEPSGDYMLRDTMSLWWRREATADGASTSWLEDHARHLHLETHVRRKLEENSRLFLGFYFSFAGAALNSLPVGWTGRALITLP